MKIYVLTPLGKRLARSTNNPDTPQWKVVHALDFRGYGTLDQITEDANVSSGEAAVAIRELKRGVNGQSIVTEAGNNQSEQQWE